MTKTYRTSQIAQIIGVHPNTIRLYERCKLIPKPERMKNGYRVFTDLHVEQLKLARTALAVEVLQNGLRKQAIEIIKTSATGKFTKAISLCQEYLWQIKEEQKNALEAITLVRDILSGKIDATAGDGLCLSRQETADYLHVSIDTLRNWELNGLLTVKRKQNGYRVYTDDDIKQLKIIRSLRCANYSLTAILRLLSALSRDPGADLATVIDTPQSDDDIISACDKLLTSLSNAERNAKQILILLKEMKARFG